MLKIPLHKEKGKWLRKYLADFIANFPEKCCSSFKAGICYCRFWSLKFNCESVEKLRALEKFEALLKLVPR
jgi:hypothetical protein